MTAHTGPLTEEEARSLPRTQLFLSATIRFAHVCAPVRLRDLSASGVRIEGLKLPAAGTVVQIARGSLTVTGTTVWSDGKSCGVRFDEPLPIDEWTPGLASRDQRAVDEMVEAVRSGSGQVLPFPSTQAKGAVGEVLPQRLAEELAYVGRLLEALGDDLSTEPLIVMRHADKLQNLDLSMQILRGVATILTAEQPEQAIDSIGMASLRNRLRRTTL